ncbi:MAG: hypothetical protein E7773_05555 [Sphingomonas sp.]|uniref:hypothetical protein n=1 Tax=Sphingomonas sp. TaxID=28214 RepID=UPI0012061F5B|nr:hypothetical protein [Sphingomonas sp.]THD36997.1 MAG: hypothetical protein E7773_05555 [Sphingomonas sp.]
MTLRDLGLALLVSIGTAAPALAQDADSAGWPLPRNDVPGTPSASPTVDDCARKACIYLVNLSNHRVTQFRYATAPDKSSLPQWSGNQFAPNYDFYSKRWTAWYPPKLAGCILALKVVMSLDGKDHEESGTFDVCANPTLLFTIQDPTEPRGTVTVDPLPDDPAPAAKP